MKSGPISNSNMMSDHTYDVQEMPLNIMISPNYNYNSRQKHKGASQKENAQNSPDFSDDKFSEVRLHKDGRRK